MGRHLPELVRKGFCVAFLGSRAAQVDVIFQIISGEPSKRLTPVCLENRQKASETQKSIQDLSAGVMVSRAIRAAIADRDYGNLRAQNCKKGLIGAS